MLGMTVHVPLFLLGTHTQDVRTKSPDTKTNPIFRHVGVKGVGSGLLDESIAPAGFPRLINRIHLQPIKHPLSTRKRANVTSFVKYFSTYHKCLVSQLFEEDML
jgi:hypothetical protein